MKSFLFWGYYSALPGKCNHFFTGVVKYAGKLKSIAVYGSDCKKLYEIHVGHTHGGMPEHYHPWNNGHPMKVGTGKNAHNAAFPLTAELKQLLQQVKRKVPHV